MGSSSMVWIKALMALAPIVVGVSATAAPLPCATLQASIAEKLSANGVGAYFLAIVSIDEVGKSDEVVGSCDGGTKRILYERTTSSQISTSPNLMYLSDYGSDACILVKASDIQILARKVPSFWGKIRQGSLMRASATGCDALKTPADSVDGRTVSLTVKGLSVNQLANGRASFRYLIYGSKV
jgi:hypothetical protein